MMSTSFSNNDIRKSIERQLAVILRRVDFSSQKIKVHLNVRKGDDYPRMAFVLFALSRAYKNGLLESVEGLGKEKLVGLFWDIYAQSLQHVSERELFYVQLYGMRLLSNYNEPYTRIIEDFAHKRYASIYEYPVSAYVYMSAYIECGELGAKYDFAHEIFLQCKKMFDFVLYSNERDKYLPFHFAELSLFDGHMEASLLVQAKKVMRSQFENGYLSKGVSASGVAKCMEDFARCGDMEMLRVCETFLGTRRLSRFREYMRSDQEDDMEYMFTEEKGSQYVCLDTNAHLLNAYINYYEKNK